MLALGAGEVPPIVLTEALRGEGDRRSSGPRSTAHKAALEAAGELEERRARNLAAEVFAVASARARRHLENAVARRPRARCGLLDEVRRRKLDPLTAVHEILRKVFHIDDEDDTDAR